MFGCVCFLVNQLSDVELETKAAPIFQLEVTTLWHWSSGEAAAPALKRAHNSFRSELWTLCGRIILVFLDFKHAMLPGHSENLTSRFPTLLIRHQRFVFCSTEGRGIRLPSHLQHKTTSDCWCERTLSDTNRRATLFVNARDTLLGFSVIGCSWRLICGAHVDLDRHNYRKTSRATPEKSVIYSSPAAVDQTARQSSWSPGRYFYRGLLQPTPWSVLKDTEPQIAPLCGVFGGSSYCSQSAVSSPKGRRHNCSAKVSMNYSEWLNPPKSTIDTQSVVTWLLASSINKSGKEKMALQQ